MSHSALHFSVERALWRIACRDEASGSTLTRDLPFSALFRKYCIIAETRIESSDDKRILKELEKQAERLSNERNKLIHSLWIMEDGRPISRYNRKVPVSEATFPTVDEITTIAKGIASLNANFFAFDYDCFNLNSTRDQTASGSKV